MSFRQIPMSFFRRPRDLRGEAWVIARPAVPRRRIQRMAPGFGEEAEDGLVRSFEKAGDGVGVSRPLHFPEIRLAGCVVGASAPCALVPASSRPSHSPPSLPLIDQSLQHRR